MKEERIYRKAYIACVLTDTTTYFQKPMQYVGREEIIMTQNVGKCTKSAKMYC